MSTRAVGAVLGVFLLVGCSGSSDEDVDALAPELQEEAHAMAAGWGISEIPDVEPVRIIDLHEWASVQSECLIAAGYPVEVHEDGEGLDLSQIEPEVIDEFNAERLRCEMTYPVDPKYYEPLSQSQLTRLYEYRSTTLIECMEEEGYIVSEEPPSEALFFELDGGWSPYEHVSLTPAGYASLTQACPQGPDDLYDD